MPCKEYYTVDGIKGYHCYLDTPLPSGTFSYPPTYPKTPLQTLLEEQREYKFFEETRKTYEKTAYNPEVITGWELDYYMILDLVMYFGAVMFVLTLSRALYMTLDKIYLYTHFKLYGYYEEQLEREKLSRVKQSVELEEMAERVAGTEQQTGEGGKISHQAAPVVVNNFVAPHSGIEELCDVFYHYLQYNGNDPRVPFEQYAEQEGKLNPKMVRMFTDGMAKKNLPEKKRNQLVRRHEKRLARDQTRDNSTPVGGPKESGTTHQLEYYSAEGTESSSDEYLSAQDDASENVTTLDTTTQVLEVHDEPIQAPLICDPAENAVVSDGGEVMTEEVKELTLSLEVAEQHNRAVIEKQQHYVKQKLEIAYQESWRLALHHIQLKGKQHIMFIVDDQKVKTDSGTQFEQLDMDKAVLLQRKVMKSQGTSTKEMPSSLYLNGLIKPIEITQKLLKAEAVITKGQRMKENQLAMDNPKALRTCTEINNFHWDSETDTLVPINTAYPMIIKLTEQEATCKRKTYYGPDQEAKYKRNMQGKTRSGRSGGHAGTYRSMILTSGKDTFRKVYLDDTGAILFEISDYTLTSSELLEFELFELMSDLYEEASYEDDDDLSYEQHMELREEINQKWIQGIMEMRDEGYEFDRESYRNLYTKVADEVRGNRGLTTQRHKYSRQEARRQEARPNETNMFMVMQAVADALDDGLDPDQLSLLVEPMQKGIVKYFPNSLRSKTGKVFNNTEQILTHYTRPIKEVPALAIGKKNRAREESDAITVVSTEPEVQVINFVNGQGVTSDKPLDVKPSGYAVPSIPPRPEKKRESVRDKEVKFWMDSKSNQTTICKCHNTRCVRRGEYPIKVQSKGDSDEDEPHGGILVQETTVMMCPKHTLQQLYPYCGRCDQIAASRGELNIRFGTVVRETSIFGEGYRELSHSQWCTIATLMGKHVRLTDYTEVEQHTKKRWKLANQEAKPENSTKENLMDLLKLNKRQLEMLERQVKDIKEVIHRLERHIIYDEEAAQADSEAEIKVYKHHPRKQEALVTSNPPTPKHNSSVLIHHGEGLVYTSNAVMTRCSVSKKDGRTVVFGHFYSVAHYEGSQDVKGFNIVDSSSIKIQFPPKHPLGGFEILKACKRYAQNDMCAEVIAVFDCGNIDGVELQRDITPFQLVGSRCTSDNMEEYVGGYVAVITLGTETMKEAVQVGRVKAAFKLNDKSMRIDYDASVVNPDSDSLEGYGASGSIVYFRTRVGSKWKPFGLHFGTTSKGKTNTAYSLDTTIPPLPKELANYL